MIGEGSGFVQDRGLNVLYRVTLNTLLNLTDDGLTAANTCYNPTAADVRITSDVPSGIVAGQVLMAGTVNGTAVKSDASAAPLGVAVNNAVGSPYESMSGVGSGKVPYINGAGSVFATDIYEVYDHSSAALTYAAGDELYVSANGILTNESGINDQTVVGIVIIAPTAQDPFMAVQMRI